MANRDKKYKLAEKIGVGFCIVGCSLMLLQHFIETDFEMFPLILGLNGIGLAAFLYSRTSQ